MRTGETSLVDLSSTEQLARELWEAYATLNQQLIAFPMLHWDECGEATWRHWRSLAAWRSRSARPDLCPEPPSIAAAPGQNAPWAPKAL